mmetsp:Transcript_12149/g.34826  ORF Transcript_12149/g.34826 Transcript_12149/m.34826 type:complete len:295 (-) Transcript_12149:772-1656(-)
MRGRLRHVLAAGLRWPGHVRELHAHDDVRPDYGFVRNVRLADAPGRVADYAQCRWGGRHRLQRHADRRAPDGGHDGKSGRELLRGRRFGWPALGRRAGHAHGGAGVRRSLACRGRRFHGAAGRDHGDDAGRLLERRGRHHAHGHGRGLRAGRRRHVAPGLGRRRWRHGARARRHVRGPSRRPGLGRGRARRGLLARRRRGRGPGMPAMGLDGGQQRRGGRRGASCAGSTIAAGAQPFQGRRRRHARVGPRRRGWAQLARQRKGWAQGLPRDAECATSTEGVLATRGCFDERGAG